MSEQFDFDTRAVRAGTERTAFNEHSEALFLTSSFVFDSAAQAAARFAGSEPGYVYSRFSNPTVTMFERRLASLEGAEDCLATASGMAAIMATCLATLKTGDHVLCGANVFGATVQLFSTVLARFGVEVTYVRAADPGAWRAAVTPRTRLMYCETPSNPLMEIVDLADFAAVGRDSGALTIVDNCFCTPVLQRPLEYGVDAVIHSATKYLDGQGRVVGGAVLGSRALIRDQVLPVLRTTGPSLSPFNAWVLLKGLETLAVRMRAQCSSALQLAQWLEQQAGIARVHFPGLASHPQAALAARQQSLPGAVVAFELAGATPEEQRARAWRLIDGTKVMSITANLGDTRSTITHPATTTHGRLSAEARERAGITEGLVRIAVGLESIDDLKSDLAGALAG
ncbi:MAG: O-succinylhomoserine sulfhydrylase [Burkholderiaceae bacterium]|jgi:O-succinylhomoserine sulfhydrylase|nr:O-succinylhomoserine sulfhydrylase [Burkholderiaceae bacterium]